MALFHEVVTFEPENGGQFFTLIPLYLNHNNDSSLAEDFHTIQLAQNSSTEVDFCVSVEYNIKWSVIYGRKNAYHSGMKLIEICREEKADKQDYLCISH